MSSNGTAVARKPRFSEALSTEGYRKLINRTLQDENRAKRFIASISSAVAVNTALQECDAGTILAGALLGESLNLSPSPQLGQYYLVPFKDTKNKRTVATFILGYKGYVQLALRSGQYRKLNVMAIKKGELVSYDPLAEEIEVNLIQDELQRETAETVGYYAMFEYVNGFRKTLYWSRTKMEQHALRYSAGYKSDRKNNTKHTFWSKNFDDMAYKTMLRQLIGKWGIMSLEMQTGFASENTVATMDSGGEIATEYITGPELNELADGFAEIAAEVVDEVPSGAAEIVENDDFSSPPENNGATKQIQTLEDV